MKRSTDDNWWMDVFDELYLETDSRSVCDARLTGEEVDFLDGALDIGKGCPILDLCGGQGRHALEMSRRGYANITVLDYSQCLLSIGRKRAATEKLAVDFIRGDARHAAFQDGRFQFIMIMGSSFGYFPRENENVKILTEAFRLLTPGGRLLLDLPDKDHVIGNFKPRAHHRTRENLVVIRERELKKNVLYCREKVVKDSGRCLRDNVYCIRLYSQASIERLLAAAGFAAVRFTTDFMCRNDDGDYGCMTHRMIVVAEKRA